MSIKEDLDWYDSLEDERDYIAVLADALSGLKNIPPEERSEEVGSTLDAVIEDLDDLLIWLRGGDEQEGEW